MANNVQTQLYKAIEMKATVQDSAAILTQKMDDLEERLHYYVRAGFPEDIAENYRHSYYVQTRSIIDELIKTMLTSHVEFLDKVIADLKDASEQR